MWLHAVVILWIRLRYTTALNVSIVSGHFVGTSKYVNVKLKTVRYWLDNLKILKEENDGKYGMGAKFEQVWNPDSFRIISYPNNKNVHVSMIPYYYLIHVIFQKQINTSRSRDGLLHKVALLWKIKYNNTL